MIFSGCAYFQQQSGNNDNQLFRYTIPEPADEIPSSVVKSKEPPEQKKSEEKNVSDLVSGEYKKTGRLRGWGYKIQIFSTLQQDEAEKVAQEIGEKLDEKVYIEFNPPYYKVRIGNCSNSDDAEELLAQIKKLGYPNAWIVRARIVEQE
ncbi:hypothetical protein DRQ33_02305 [bacterium]|nr:MAG: hypothetical protein DRQ33_02305 [bacterium]